MLSVLVLGRPRFFLAGLPIRFLAGGEAVAEDRFFAALAVEPPEALMFGRVVESLFPAPVPFFRMPFLLGVAGAGSPVGLKETLGGLPLPRFVTAGADSSTSGGDTLAGLPLPRLGTSDVASGVKAAVLPCVDLSPFCVAVVFFLLAKLY